MDTLKGDRVLKDYSSYKDKVYQQTDYLRDRDIQVEINKVFQGFEKGETPFKPRLYSWIMMMNIILKKIMNL